MKSVLKKLGSANKAILLRFTVFGILFLAFYVLVLYVLINSPA